MITRVVNWLFAAFLLSVGLYLTIRGATLISLGGSWYYTLAGLGLLGVVALLIMRNGFAGTLYAIIVAATVIWSIPEAGLDLLALLPRLMAWIVVGLWFYMPWYRSYVKTGGGSAWVGGASLVAVALLAISAFQKHPVVEYDRVVPEETVAEDDWVRYGKTDEGTRFSALTQITPEKSASLKKSGVSRPKSHTSSKQRRSRSGAAYSLVPPATSSFPSMLRPAKKTGAIIRSTETPARPGTNSARAIALRAAAGASPITKLVLVTKVPAARAF